MLVKEENVDLEMLATITGQMISLPYSSDYWLGLINGMNLNCTSDDIQTQNMWYIDCVYSKLFGNGLTTSVVAGTPKDILDANFSDVIQYGVEQGYFTIDNVLDAMSNIR